MRQSDLSARKLAVSAMLLAIGLLLPFLTGQIRGIGNMLCPMHLPVLICGFVCGPLWGCAVGAVLPLLRSALFGMPVLMPSAVGMAFELAAYGLLSGLLRRRLPRTLPMLYLALVASMLLGRVVWGVASVFLYGAMGNAFTLSIFLTNGFVSAVPGIVLQLLLVPPIVLALERAHLAE